MNRFNCRIEREEILAFIKKAGKDGLTASEIVRTFIQMYIHGEIYIDIHKPSGEIANFEGGQFKSSFVQRQKRRDARKNKKSKKK